MKLLWRTFPLIKYELVGIRISEQFYHIMHLLCIGLGFKPLYNSTDSFYLLYIKCSMKLGVTDGLSSLTQDFGFW